MRPKYKPDEKGMTAFTQSSMVGNAMHRVATELAQAANSGGESVYAARRRVVQGGEYAQDRAGAEVAEVERDMADVWNRTLSTLARSYRMRGGG